MTVRFSPPLDCGEGSRELALVDLQTTNTVLNVRDGCNSVIYYEDGKPYVLSVPDGTYNVGALHE